MNELKAGFLLVGLIVLFILVAMCNPISIVGVGERGVKVTLGRVSPESYSEGVHFTTPFISHIETMSVKTQKSNIATMVFTKDIQQARLTYVINYNLQPENVHKMYKQVGKNYQDTILVPIVEGGVCKSCALNPDIVLGDACLQHEFTPNERSRGRQVSTGEYGLLNEDEFRILQAGCCPLCRQARNDQTANAPQANHQ